MKNVRLLGSSGRLLALLMWSACNDGGDKGDAPESTPTADASVRAVDAGVGNSVNPATSDPFTDLINNLFGAGGLSGVTSLLGDGGLSGLTGLFSGGGQTGGFDPTALCAQIAQLCLPDAGPVPTDAGVDAGDQGSADAGVDGGNQGDAGADADVEGATDASDDAGSDAGVTQDDDGGADAAASMDAEADSGNDAGSTEDSGEVEDGG
jgi:hypothetical protein